jgi:hypothetical protein
VALVVDRGTDGVRTHALVVGVGEYSHLLGGDQRRKVVQDVPLGQLTSPPVSARAFVDWLASTHNCPAAPLGTVEVLLSPPGRYELPPGSLETGSQYDVEVANWPNVEAASSAWWERCDANPNNVAMFYFCGHGLEVGNLALLLSDFGASDVNRLANAIDLHKTRLAMDACAARHQIFIVDACREFVRPLKDYPSKVGRSLFGMPIPRRSRKTSTIYHATARGDIAEGDENEVSRYTSALITALDGAGATEVGANEEWAVTLDSLSYALGVLLEADNQEPTRGGELLSNSPPLHLLSSAPQVQLELACAPDAELQHALLALLAQPPAEEHWHRSPAAATPWRLEVPAGPYLFEATSETNRWPPPRPRRVPAKPPRVVQIAIKVGE